MNKQQTIPNQVRLPLAVAFEVVLQGIRIRFGRSVVTMTGVACGIAFLTSMLTGQIFKREMAQEDERRQTVARIMNFVGAELPSLQNKTVGLVQAGALDETENRVLARLYKRLGDGRLLVLTPEEAPAAAAIAGGEASSPEKFWTESAVLFVMGDGPLPALDWEAFAGSSGNAMVATTRTAECAPPIPKAQLVLLARAPTEEELLKQAAQARTERFRAVWITVVSLLVTVIGITNAMLMSVAERFREIGTMKCLGALSSFIRRIFVLESSLMGLVGGLVGAVSGSLFSLGVFSFTYGPSLVFAAFRPGPLLGLCAASVIVGIALSVIAALYPARVASRMVPATALRSNV